MTDAAATVAEVQQRETHRCLCPTRAPHTYACLVLRLVDAERDRDVLGVRVRELETANALREQFQSSGTGWTQVPAGYVSRLTTQRGALAAALREMLRRHCPVDRYCAVPEHGVARVALAALKETKP